MFWLATNAEWARAGCYSISQDSINELFKCILRVARSEKGSPLFTIEILTASMRNTRLRCCAHVIADARGACERLAYRVVLLGVTH